MEWFQVDKKGLAKLLESRGKAFALHELISNAWDEKASHVDVRLARIPNSQFVELEVEDDNPDGFADLAHAFVLLAESRKKGDPASRGRFNLGEKLVLSLFEEAEIVSTSGTVRFDEQGRHCSRVKREARSLFREVLRMTAEELAECCASVTRLIPPQDIRTTFNGQPLVQREPLRVFEATVPTELADDEVDFGATMGEEDAALFEGPFARSVRVPPGKHAEAADAVHRLEHVVTRERMEARNAPRLQFVSDRSSCSRWALIGVRQRSCEQSSSPPTRQARNDA